MNNQKSLFTVKRLYNNEEAIKRYSILGEINLQLSKVLLLQIVLQNHKILINNLKLDTMDKNPLRNLLLCCMLGFGLFDEIQKIKKLKVEEPTIISLLKKTDNELTEMLKIKTKDKFLEITKMISTKVGKATNELFFFSNTFLKEDILQCELKKYKKIYEKQQKELLALNNLTTVEKQLINITQQELRKEFYNLYTLFFKIDSSANDFEENLQNLISEVRFFQNELSKNLRKELIE